MRSIILFFFLLAACSSHSQWTAQSLPAREVCYKSSLLQYHSCDRTSGIDIAFLASEKTLTTYLEVPSGCIHNPVVKVTTKGRVLTFEGEIHSGGQRLRLPPAAQEFFIAALERGQPLTLYLDGYCEKIDSIGFTRGFNKMAHPGPRLPNVKLLWIAPLRYDGPNWRHYE